MVYQTSKEGQKMTHFSNYTERKMLDAIELLTDENLVWSSDFEAIRLDLAKLLERLLPVKWHNITPEIDTLCLNLIGERENNARGFRITN